MLFLQEQVMRVCYQPRQSRGVSQGEGFAGRPGTTSPCHGLSVKERPTAFSLKGRR